MVDRLLDALDVRFENAQRGRARVGDDRCREVGPDVEQVVLHAEQELLDVGGQAAERECDAESRVGLIAVAKGGQSLIGLRRARAVDEGGRSVVAGLGVDARQVNRHARSLRNYGLACGDGADQGHGWRSAGG